jgi:predicted PurR-regulated permease PerM
MTLEILTIILGILVVVLGYTTLNLLFKNEKSEDIIISQNKFIQQFTQTINESQQRLNEIDQKGIFQSDDEIGWFFNEIKKIQSLLSNSTINE